MTTPSSRLATKIEQGVLIGDGAMGTMLFEAGLPLGHCPELWNLEQAEAVESISRSYASAGSLMVQTNTFGGSSVKLDVFGLGDRSVEINLSGARAARRGAGQETLVLGSIGPTGKLLEPLGDLSPDRAIQSFREQAEALAEGGVDALLVETMTDLGEALLAVRAASSTGLPVLATMTFERTPRGFFTIMGVSLAQMAKELPLAGAFALGSNCGIGTETMVEIVAELRGLTEVPILVQPNAGLPTVTGGTLIYPETPEDMAAQLGSLIGAGADMIGGCCGTAPRHISQFVQALRQLEATGAGTKRCS